VSSCPSLYSVASDGVSCEKTGEFIIPFIPLFLWLISVAAIAVVKWRRKETMFLSSFIVMTSYFVILLIIIIIILQFRDSHYQSAIINMMSLFILFTLNFNWNFFIYRREIRKDILFNVWIETFPRMEKFVYWSAYFVSFQCFRISYCQFAQKPHFDASVLKVELMYIKLNRFSILQILLVIIPVLASCIYNLFWTEYLRQVFWHDLEIIIILFLMLIAIIIDVWTKDESELNSNFVDKKEFSKNIDLSNKSLLTNTIMYTKEDLFSARYLNKDNEPDKFGQGGLLQKAYFDKNGQPIYNDIGNFEKLIHKEQDGEVVSSQDSVNVGPHKQCNEFDPFAKKYQTGSPSKNGKYGHSADKDGNFRMF
jgi:hypothetical protein